MSLQLAILTGLMAGAVLAWWSYRERWSESVARGAAFCRLIGTALVVLLLLNPPLSMQLFPLRPLVLIDNSISMHAGGGNAQAARAAAATLGDTVPFGELTPGEPGGGSRLMDVLPTALASGRPIIVVTDGEIPDAPFLPAELLSSTGIRLFPRATGDNVALTELRGTSRVAAGDTLHLIVEARRTAGVSDSVPIAVWEGTTRIASATILLSPTGRGRIDLAVQLPGETVGTRWLEVRRVGAPDAEAGDDTRWWGVVVTPTPGIVVIASAPDWDARVLYRALRDVTESPVRGYLQFQPGIWRRMDDLRRVPTAEVEQAARRADLLAVRGDPQPWRQSGRARLLWPPATVSGDWYLRATTASPVAGAYGSVDPDSLPPAVAILPLDAEATRAWTGATARLARRGSEVPVIGGREGSGGRTVTLAADGLYRWAFRGGASEQVWRTMIADAAAWLLATPDSVGVSVRATALVTQRGRPVRFQWVGKGAPMAMPITLTDSVGPREDTLRFDGTGKAALALPVGRYDYTVSSGAGASFAVEPFADELVPAPVTLAEQSVQLSPVRTGHGARESLLFFAGIVVAFGTEWMLRRRLGMR